MSNKSQAEKNTILKFVRDRFNTRISDLTTEQDRCFYSYEQIEGLQEEAEQALRSSPAGRALIKANPLFKVKIDVQLASKQTSRNYYRNGDAVLRPDAIKTHASIKAQIAKLNREWDVLNQSIILYGITPEIQKMVENFMKVLA